MVTRISSAVFLVVSILIGLGAFGHGSSVRRVHAAIDQFPIEKSISETLYVVWYAASVNMILFGVILVWIWTRVRAGDSSTLLVAELIAISYVITAVFGLVLRHGDRFWYLFLVLGGLLLISSIVLRMSPRTS
jgi:hypothetical protein